MLTSTSSLLTNEYRIPEDCADITLLLRLRMCPSKQSIAQTSTWRPWLKNTCSESVGRTDCTACRWPSQHGLLIFLISVVTEIKFVSLTPPHQPNPLRWLRSSWLHERILWVCPQRGGWGRVCHDLTMTTTIEKMSLTNPAFVTGQAVVITDYLLAWHCNNSDIWWKEDKDISGVISDKQPSEKPHHLLHNFPLFMHVNPWIVNKAPCRFNQAWHSPLSPASSFSPYKWNPSILTSVFLVYWSWHKVLAGVLVLCFQR